MATPAFDEYLTVGGLMLGSRALRAFQFDAIKSAAKRHADNFVAAGVAGRTARAPIRDELRAPIEIRINATYNQNNQVVAQSARRAALGTLRDTLYAVLEDNTLQALTWTYPGGSRSADCQVVEITGFTLDSPWVARVAAVLVVPSGSWT